jgi:hypothetical protein
MSKHMVGTPHGGKDETYGLDEVVFQAQAILDGACCRSLQGMLLRAPFASSECERPGCMAEAASGHNARKVVCSITDQPRVTRTLVRHEIHVQV